MELLHKGHRRVVITGLGATSVLGDAVTLWDRLKNGESGISRLTSIDTGNLPVSIGGEITGFDPLKNIERKEARRMGRASQFALSTALDALADAGFESERSERDAERTAVVIGTTLACHEVSEQNTYKFRLAPDKKPNPMSLMNALPNMPGHYVSRFLQAYGPLITPSAACAAGTQAIGIASDLIKHGQADIVIAGGVEAMLQDYIIAAFCAMKGLAEGYNEEPTLASRPFDAYRNGFVIAEGCGILVLESLSHAVRRGAKIYCEVLGHGSSSDGYHVAAIEPNGDGVFRCMKWAIDNAQIDAEQIGYINAHGTSTRSNDLIETTAIKRLFGQHAYKLQISSSKSMIGHALGGSGALEAIACAYSLREKVVHPTINQDTPDSECDLDYVPNVARDMPNLQYAMSNSFGLGGQNSSVVFGAVN